MRESFEQIIKRNVAELVKQTEGYDDAMSYAEDMVTEVKEDFPHLLPETIRVIVHQEIRRQSNK